MSLQELTASGFATSRPAALLPPPLRPAGVFCLLLLAPALAAAQTAGTLKWEYPTPDNGMGSSPAIADDGTIYAATRGFSPALHAVNPDGTGKWTYDAGGDILSTPAIGPDGTIYFGMESEPELHAVNPDGTEKWILPINGETNGSPAIGLDGTIYIGMDGGGGDDNFFAVNPDGTVKWSFDTGEWIGTSPAVGVDGTVYVASDDAWLHALNPDGTEQWRFDLTAYSGSSLPSSPALGIDGAIYIGNGDGNLYAINPGGTLRWTYDTGAIITSSPAIATDGTIYVGDWTGVLSAVNPDGSLKWELPLGNDIESSPAIGADGTVYVVRFGQRLHAVASDGSPLWDYGIGGSLSSPAIAPDGTVFVGGWESLSAIYSDSPGPAESSWPMFRQNVERTGRAENLAIPLKLGQPFQIGLQLRQAHNYSLETVAGESLLVEVTADAGISSLALFGQHRGIAYQATEPTPRGTWELVITPTAAGEYLLTVVGTEVDAGGGQYTILADYMARHLSDVEPRTGGNAGTVSLLVTGLGFEPGMTAELRQGATTLTAAAVTVASGSELLARFDLIGTSLGTYELRAIWPDMSWQSLDGAFEIVAGQGPALEAELMAPEATRPDRRYTLWLEYANTGDADMEAPLFSVRSNALLSLDGEAFPAQRVEILGVGGSSDPHILRAGESRRLAIFFLSPSSGDAWFELHQTVNLTAAIDWAAQKDLMKPPDMDPAEWDTVWPALVARLGTTWGDYIAVLHADAQRLAARGAPAQDVARMIRLEMLLATGDPVAAVSGILRHADTHEPLVGVALRLRNADGTVLRQTETTHSPPGHFLIVDLADDTYDLYLDGYLFDPPQSVIVAGVDVTGLELYARDLPAPEDAAEVDTPQHRPAVTFDETGTLYVVWQQGDEIWWARNSASGWDASGAIPNAQGSHPVIAYDAGLLDGGLAPGLFVAWETLESPSILRWSVGQPGVDDIVWTEPQALTGDAFNDSSLAVLVDELDDPLVLWLQRDLEVEDDTDLYYLGLDLSAAALQSSAGVEARPTSDAQSIGSCEIVDTTYIGNRVDETYPAIGGLWGFWAFTEYCPPQECTLEWSTQSFSLFVNAGVLMAGDLKGSYGPTSELSAKWTTDECQCSYILDEGSFSVDVVYLNAEESAFLLPREIEGHQRQLKLTAAEPDIGCSFFADLTSRASFPVYWNAGSASVLCGPDIRGSFDRGEGETVGEVEGISAVIWDYPPGTFSKACVRLEGGAKTSWGIKEAFCEIWGSGGCASCPPPPAPIQGQSAASSGPSTSQISFEKDPLVGTGASYEGTPVLGDISGDLYNDGAPAAAKSASEELLVVWTKAVPAAAATRLGAEVWSTSYAGTSWGSPVGLTTQADFNKHPALVFDSAGNAMAVWSHASSAGLDYDTDSVEELLAAMEVADIVYARRVGDSWSAPATLSVLAGRDEKTALAAGPSGQVTAAWLNQSASGWTLYASIWSGSAWSTPQAVATPVAADRPAVAYVGSTPTILWAQDDDDDTDTFDDWRLYASVWGGSSWSEPAPLSLPLSATTTVEARQDQKRVSALPDTSLSSASSLTLPQPPQHCCRDCGGSSPSSPDPPDNDQDQLDSDSSSTVAGIDPNEKIGTLGQAEGHYVDAGDRLSYTVYFENLAAATAPAQEVFVTDCLPPELDWTTLRVNEVAFGDVIVANPTESFLFQERVTIPDYRPAETKDWWVDILPEFDFVTGCLDVTLRTLDPETEDLPLDPFAGFLPPEDGSGRGQGHIALTINAKADLVDGTTIDNLASIVFDTNDPIVTNTWSNTIGEPGDCGSGIFNSLTLADQVIDTTEVFTACRTITVGPNCQISWPAAVTLRAGEEIRFANDVEIGPDTVLSAEIDPALLTP